MNRRPISSLLLFGSLLLLIATITLLIDYGPEPALADTAAPAACPQDPAGGGPKERFRVVDTGNSRVQGFTMDDGDNVSFGGSAGSAGSDDGELSSPSGVGHVIGTGTYVADSGNNRIQVFDWKLRFDFAFDGSESDDAPGSLDNPTDVAISKAKRVYVADADNDRIMVFNLKGEYLDSWGSTGGGNGEFRHPYAVAVSRSNDDVYVVDRGNDRVQWFDSDGTYKGQWNSGGGALSDPVGITVHPTSGDVYVVDRARNEVIQFQSDGTFIRDWGGNGNGNGEFDGPMDVTATPVHGVVVADTGNDRLQRFSDSGSFLEVIGSSGSGEGEFNSPRAVTARLTGVRLQDCYIHNFTLDGEPRQITVFYTLNSGLPRHHVPNNTDSGGNNIYAREVAEMTETAWRTFASYGLKEPAHKRNNVELNNGATGDDLNVWMFGETMAGRCCHRWGYQIKAGHVQSSVDNNSDSAFNTVVHELFHSIQFNHGYGQGSQPGFHWEGGAANSQDKVDAAIDDDPGSGYTGRVRRYLGSGHETDIRELKYIAALFWTYFQEQLTDGSMSEPAYGIEVTDTLMRDILTDYRGLDGVAQALRQMDDHDRSLEQFWIDFVVANYVKEYDGVGDEHHYVDDDALPDGYRDISPQEVALSSSNSEALITGTLSAYSAQYLRLRPDITSCPYVMVEVDSERRLSLTLANHRGDSLISPLETRKGNRLAVTLRTAQPISGADDGAGLILGGLREKGDYEVNVACVTPTLDIVQPTTDHPGFAGPHDDPGTVIATVEVSNNGAAPVKGLEPGQFTAAIGGEAAPVLGANYVDDLYVLVLDAPPQASAGTYDLIVTLDDDQSDSETDAVRYTSQVRDNMLVLDRSGSMGSEGRLFAAKQAAQLQITDMDRNAWAGLVSFNDSVSLDFDLQDITDNPERSDLRGEVSALQHGGLTNIVAGVDTAMDELDTNGGDDHACFVTLLTDGMDNQASSAEKASLLSRLGSSDCQVYAIALGPEADKTLLQEVTDASGGKLYISTISPGGSEAPTAIAPAEVTGDGYAGATWEHRLMGIFEEIALQQEGRERLYVGAEASPGTYTDTISVDDSLSELVFAVQNDGFYGETKIYDPDGNLVDVELYPGLSYQATSYHRFYRIENPLDGEWKVVVTSSIASSFPGHLFTVSGHTPVALEVVAHAPTGPMEAGKSVPIIAILHDDSGLIPGADVRATVESSTGLVTELRLYDDGEHGDGAAGDGIYGNSYRGAIQASCRTDSETGNVTVCDNAFQVNATATKGDIRREASTAFAITTAADSDGDGIPDVWEEENGTDPYRDDAQEDPDADGLTNEQEFWFGTDPLNPDSDNGGENDASEVFGGGDPNDPTDDRVPPLHGIQVRPGDGEVGIVYTPLPAFDTINIYRRIQGSNVWDTVVLGEPVTPSGVYTDTTAVNDQGYIYRLVPVIPGGFGGSPVTSIEVTPATDTDAPEGMLTINGGAPETTSKRVMLDIDFEEDAIEMRLSNDGDFSDVPWEPVATSKEWDLAGDVEPGEVAVVYVQFRDASGNIGDDLYQQDSILYVENLPTYLPMIIVD
ncbi:MAG TPA: 6-bladed beta-propeller [Candidatus Sulfomarinibacteraceae bacterium]|nr:6-bladed beta-propeller [Candidatus Sulfomarinibacteraceae bacterium]